MLNDTTNGNAANQRLAWNLYEAAAACGVSVPYLRKKIANREIQSTRAGRRVLIADNELRRWLGINRTGDGEQAAA